MDWSDSWYGRTLRRAGVTFALSGIAGVIAYLAQLEGTTPQQIAFIMFLTTLLMAADKALRDHTD
ncbi:TPA_asm: hypothetical protein vir520_00024 [Caudoviricetes sp. vir520]|nr:TPA_asm: hypothetical protein vir520_00024 [Caudoviricetes sp. vir520]